ncbi:MAG: S8 family serine peptidase [Actinomycetia bacterium]|nr:S8 family serine peptidase [Actinomycetes bacterium]
MIRSPKPPDVRISGEAEAELPEPDDRTVTIGIIDVGGFDFAHPDFMRDGKTRFEKIWDQGAIPSPPSNEANAEQAQDTNPPFGYGVVLTAEDMNRAIADAAAVGVAPSDFLPQSTMQVGSHGTHVASIAAGNQEVCPQAVLVGVTIALTAADAVAAGNSGQEAAQFEGDVGYASGRIHASGRIPAAGLIADMNR